MKNIIGRIIVCLFIVAFGAGVRLPWPPGGTGFFNLLSRSSQSVKAGRHRDACFAAARFALSRSQRKDTTGVSPRRFKGPGDSLSPRVQMVYPPVQRLFSIRNISAYSSEILAVEHETWRADRGIQRDILSSGATLFHRLPDDAWKRLRHFEVSGGKYGGDSYIFVSPEERRYYNVSSSLRDLERFLMVDPVADIKARIDRYPQGLVVIVDWGCGQGTMLQDLADILREQGILSRVKLIGFSNMFFLAWHYAAKEILFILDNETQFSRYFKLQEIDVIYSQLGLSHLTGEAYRNHVKQLQSRIKNKGTIIHDGNFAHLSVLHRRGWSVSLNQLFIQRIFKFEPIQDINYCIERSL